MARLMYRPFHKRQVSFLVVKTAKCKRGISYVYFEANDLVKDISCNMQYMKHTPKQN